MKSLALAIFLLGLAGQARAQAPKAPEAALLPPDDELADVLDGSGMTAERAYDLGARLFAAGRYEAAELAWLRAYSLARDPVLLVAVADTRARRGDEPGAAAMLEKYLEERPDAPDRLAIEARLATLLRSPARLVIRSPQPGRAILLDFDVPDLLPHLRERCWEKRPSKLRTARSKSSTFPRSLRGRWLSRKPMKPG